jgi:hypothetical protein
MFEVCFQYDESVKLWEVFVKGAADQLEALQGFNAVILTTRQAVPSVNCNRAEKQEDGSFKISVGY